MTDILAQAQEVAQKRGVQLLIEELFTAIRSSDTEQAMSVLDALTGNEATLALALQEEQGQLLREWGWL